jgi:hypothetical protein
VSHSTVISRSLFGMSDETMNTLDSSESLTEHFTHKVTESYPCGLLKNRSSGTYVGEQL